MKTKTDLATLALAALAALVALVMLLAPLGTGRGSTGETIAPEAASGESQDTAEDLSAEPADEADSERARYIETWAARIDAFNAGYPLEGHGATFAEAAYELGVDPRYSPAIARVESGSGLACTYAYNAWGWGSSSWGDWDSAIWAHVEGLAQAYGYTISWADALSYNEEAPDEWYSQVETCMYQIWDSDSL